MTRDRTGEEIDPDEPLQTRAHHCYGGWLGYDSDSRPIPCLVCRPHLAKTMTTNDFSQRIPSYDAQRAIDREEGNV